MSFDFRANKTPYFRPLKSKLALQISLKVAYKTNFECETFAHMSSVIPNHFDPCHYDANGTRSFANDPLSAQEENVVYSMRHFTKHFLMSTINSIKPND